MLTLDHILEIGGVPKTAKVKLLRHVPQEGTPEEAWKLGWLHEYERMHAADFKVPDYFVTFIPVDRTRALFLWVKKITAGYASRRNIKRSSSCPFPKHYEGEGIALDLDRLDAFNSLEGRMIVDWGSSTRGYDRWRDINEPRRLLQILPEGSVDRFPGYARVFLSFEQLQKIVKHPAQNSDWHAALSAVTGIYLITHRKGQTAYVGKASGMHGFFGRWSNYVETGGHGGNIELRQKIKAEPDYVCNLFWSIIHVLPNDTPAHEIDSLEKLTKDKFGTRIVPLNRN